MAKSGKPHKKITEPKYLLILVSIFIVFASCRSIFYELSHGDDWADGSVLIAGENFARLGFFESHGLPIFYPNASSAPPTVRPDSAEWTQLDVFGTYTRLPGFFHWMSGVLQKTIAGYDDIFFYRIFIFFFSLTSLILFFLLIRLLFESSRLAFFASLLCLSNPFFISNFDSLHQNVYMDLFRNICLLCLAYIFLRKEKNIKSTWIIAWFSLFLLSLNCYEYLPWMTISILAVAGFFYWRQEFRRAVATLLLGSGIAAGLVFHFGLVAWHYGSVKEALADRLSNAAQRIMGNENLLGSTGGLDWSVWFENVALRFPSQVSVIGWGGLCVLVGLGLAIVFSLDEANRRKLLLAFGLGLFFVFGAFLWYVLMPAHCVDHAGLSFLQKFLLPGICLLMAVPFEAALRLMESKGVDVLPRRLLCYVPVVLLALGGTLQSELPVTPAKIANEKEFLKVVECLKKLRPSVTPQDFIACNLMRPTWMMMYYTKTRVVGTGTVAEFEKLKEKPKLFLFVPINSPESQELGQFLEKSYRVLSFCENRRLPFYVMERM
jgi:hypothetical protein